VILFVAPPIAQIRFSHEVSAARCGKASFAHERPRPWLLADSSLFILGLRHRPADDVVIAQQRVRAPVRDDGSNGRQ